jgi:hypothetical protein
VVDGGRHSAVPVQGLEREPRYLFTLLIPLLFLSAMMPRRGKEENQGTERSHRTFHLPWGDEQRQLQAPQGPTDQALGERTQELMANVPMSPPQPLPASSSLEWWSLKCFHCSDCSDRLFHNTGGEIEGCLS